MRQNLGDYDSKFVSMGLQSRIFESQFKDRLPGIDHSWGKIILYSKRLGLRT